MGGRLVAVNMRRWRVPAGNPDAGDWLDNEQQRAQWRDLYGFCSEQCHLPLAVVQF